MATKLVQREYLNGGKRPPLEGCRFGLLTVVKHIGFLDHMSVWLCKCDCGNECERRGPHLVFAKRNPDAKNYQSNLHCGCLSPEGCDWKSPGYQQWRKHMTNLCPEWRLFSVFEKECVSRRGSFKHLCRTDISKPFSPANSFWSNKTQRHYNTVQRTVEILVRDQCMKEDDARDRVANMSRQRRYQIIRKSEGRCTVCGDLSNGFTKCRRCRDAEAARNKQQRSIT